MGKPPHLLGTALALLATLALGCKKQPREAAPAGPALPSLFQPPPPPGSSPAELSGPVGIIGGPFVGFGMRLRSTARATAIEFIFPDSPAAEADLRQDDLIVAIDGESTLGWPVRQVVDRLKGGAGTEVLLDVERGIDAIQVRMARRVLPAVPVPGTP